MKKQDSLKVCQPGGQSDCTPVIIYTDIIHTCIWCQEISTTALSVVLNEWVCACCVLSISEVLNEWVRDFCAMLNEQLTAICGRDQVTFDEMLMMFTYSDNRNLLTVMEAGGLGPYNLIQPTISLEMPVPSQVHCSFPSFPVVDLFCLFIDLWVLPFPLEDCSVFGNFVITLDFYSASWPQTQLLVDIWIS